jgi:DNA-binding SARP family transcriptional activator
MTVPASSFRAPVLICLLGRFSVVAHGRAMSFKPGGKAQSLLANLALSPRIGLHRDQLLESLWPSTELVLAAQCLNTLVYSLHRTLGLALDGHPPIRCSDGLYRLNAEDGVAVDIAAFDAAVDDGDRATRAGDGASAQVSYRGAVDMYRGDLVPTSDIRHVVERERLRARYLMVRARLAELRFRDGDFGGALSGALEVLASDPCREDAHRLVMRSYNRLGQRAQALRQYRACREALAAEFDAVPEAETDELYARLRMEPSRV